MSVAISLLVGIIVGAALTMAGIMVYAKVFVRPLPPPPPLEALKKRRTMWD